MPGGVNAPLDPHARDLTLAELPAAMAIVKRTLALWKGTVDRFPNEIDSFSNFPTMYCGLVGPDGSLRLYDGNLRFVGPDGSIVADQVAPADYAAYIGEATLPDSYLKAPYYKPVGYPDGIYRVGPLARLNVADRCGTPGGGRGARGVPRAVRPHRPERVPLSLRAAHRGPLRASSACRSCSTTRPSSGPWSAPTRASTTSRASASSRPRAARSSITTGWIANGAMTWANLIVATGHNNLAIGRGILQVAKRFVDGSKIQEGALNRVSALVRAYDPCLSCSTHALGTVPLRMQLVGPDGRLLDEVATD